MIGQRLCLCLAAAAMLLAARPACASSIAGYTDVVSGSVAGGWSCVPGSIEPDSVALYAGIHRIGIFPNAIDRFDTSPVCGPGIILNGFQVDLTPAITQQFYGQPNLSLYGINPSAQAALLPPSTRHAADPYAFPSGLIATLSAGGALTGLLANVPKAAMQASIAIVAGGPLGGGGTVLGNATLQPQGQKPQSFAFSSPLLGAALSGAPAGYALPVYAYFSHDGGPAIQLGSPAMLGAMYLPFASQVAQSGANSGIANTIFTRWIPARTSLRGLSGSIVFHGNNASFSETLVTIGTAAQDQYTCKLQNGTSPARLPNISRIAAFVLKANDTRPDSLPVSIALPYALPPAGPAGTCLVTWISAGYAYLTASSAKYATTTASIAAVLSPAAPAAPTSFAEGIGNEFHFASASQPSLYTISALKMAGPTQLDAIASSLSAAGLVGAPNASGWLPNPNGSWVATTSFYAYPAAECEALGLLFGNATAYYTVGLNRTPTNYVIPPEAALLLRVPLYGYGPEAAQQALFQTFADPAQTGTSRITLSAGDCLVALHNVSAPGDSLYGNLDFEDQSTAYFHVSQP